MSTTLLVDGLRIHLAEEHTQDLDIGLYTAAGVSQIRISEAALSGSSQAYASGILAADGVPEIDDGGSFERGGAFIYASSIKVQINNTSQFYRALDVAGIGINGLKCEVIEFEVSAATGLVTGERVKYYGKTCIGEWSIANYELPIEPAVHSRRAQIGQVIDSQSRADADPGDIGKLIPATYGEHLDRYAKMVRTANVNDTWGLYDLFTYLAVESGTFLPLIESLYQRKIFPIVAAGAAPSLLFTIQTAAAISHIDDEDDYTNMPSFSDVVPTDLYLYISEDAAAQGKYRKITKIARVSENKLQLTIASYFENDPTPSVTGGDAWCKIVEISRKFEFDQVPCKGFLNDDGDIDNNAINLSIYSGKKTVTVTGSAETATVKEKTPEFARIPRHGYEVAAGDTECNSAVINAERFETSPDDISSVLVVPIDYDTFEPIDEPTLGDFDYFNSSAAAVPMADYVNAGPGAYSDGTGGSKIHFSGLSYDLNDRDHLTDKDIDTYWRYTATLGNADGVNGRPFDVMLAYRFRLPDYPEDFEFDTIHIGIDAHFVGSDTGNVCALRIKSRKFLNNSEDILATDTGDNMPDAGHTYFKDVPDFYFSTSPATNNKYFYSSATGAGTSPAYINGFNNFELSGIDSREKYEAIKEIGIFLRIYGTIDAADSFGNVFDFHEIVVMFKKNATLGNELFTHCQGRKYQATWGARKVAADPILDSVDQYEDVCRRQNWSEAGDVTSIYGLEQSASALVNIARWDIAYTGLAGGTFQVGERILFGPILSATAEAYVHYDDGVDCMSVYSVSGAIVDTNTITGLSSGATATVSGSPTATPGGFEAPGMDEPHERRFVFQVTNEDRGCSDALKNQLCNALWCIGHINERGEECLSYIPKSEAGIVDTITLGSVPRGMRPGNVIEPKPSNVFCEPFVRYRWNEGAQRYDGWMGIKNVHIGTWQQAYTPGLIGGEGETYYDWCHAELWDRYHQIEQPPDDLVNRPEIYSDADAKWWLTNWINIMLLRRQQVPVLYSIAKTWFPGRHVYLQLPHQTNGASFKAIIERITKNKRSGYCMLNLAFWAESPLSYYYKDTMITQAEGAAADWKDTMDTANPEYKNQM